MSAAEIASWLRRCRPPDGPDPLNHLIGTEVLISRTGDLERVLAALDAEASRASQADRPS